MHRGRHRWLGFPEGSCCSRTLPLSASDAAERGDPFVISMPMTAPLGDAAGREKPRPASKRVAIIQSNYIPWKGYFDILNSVDEFIFLDDVQFTKRDWRNRNRIKTEAGLRWLTIPVVSKGLYAQSIDQTAIAAPWAEKHWRTLRVSYGKAPCFRDLAPRIERAYEDVAGERLLSDINHKLITVVCSILAIPTKISRSTEYPIAGKSTERLISLCQAASATEYLSGPSAASYLDIDKFAAAGISVRYADYSGYPAYPQLHGPFEHGVSILDLLFNTGPAARSYMKSFAA
jgi:WbqC-like protein family